MSKLFALAALVTLLAGGCLFSTTPPKPRDEPGSDDDPDLAVVTGLVQLYDRTDNHYRSMPGWPVKVEWFSRDLDHEGRPLLLKKRVVYSEGAGVYSAALSNPRIGSVRVRAFLCIERSPDLECCLDDDPCQNCEVWRPPVTISTAPGERLQKDLVVPCDHVP